MHIQQFGSGVLCASLVLASCSGKQSSRHDGAEPTAVDPNGYCGDETPGLLAAEGDPSVPVDALTEEPVAGSACNAVVRSFAVPNVIHVATCSAVQYQTNPPSFGDHYPLYPRYGVYAEPIPQGFWVHTLEHGGVVLTYACEDCDAELADARALVEKTEPALACCTASGCSADTTNQLLLTADPGLDTAWAASSWGFTLTADCFEPDVFGNFIAEHRDTGMTPELICSDALATDVTKAGPH